MIERVKVTNMHDPTLHEFDILIDGERIGCVYESEEGSGEWVGEPSLEIRSRNKVHPSCGFADERDAISYVVGVSK